MLGKDLSHDARALATKADKLWVNHSHQLSRSIAFCNSVPAAKKRQHDLPSTILVACTVHRKSWQQKGSPSPVALSRKSSGLCIFHW
jgi:hypothetical protein